MKRITLLLFSVLFSPLFFFSQSWDWVLQGGGSTSDKGTSIVTDANGFSYVTGYFNEAADFGSFNMPLIDEHSKEVFVAKIDPNGNYVWVVRGSNHYDDRGLGICLDPSGNIYVTGTCWGGIIFGALEAYNSSYWSDQIFLLKLDNDGNFIWLRNAGTENGDDHGHDVVSDPDGNIYVTGFTSDYCFGNNGPLDSYFGTISVPVNYGDSLGFVAKISPDGDWQWVETFGGVDGERDNRIALDQSNNVFVSGGFTGTKSFGSSTITSEGGVDIFVAKYTSNGVFQFVKNTGSELDDRANDITVDQNNFVYITGEFRDHVGFGTDTVNNNGGAGGRDIFVSKMDVNGNWKWATKAGSDSGTERGNGIIGNNNDNIFVTGQFKGSADFGDSINLTSTTPDSIEIFVAAIDTAGKWRWALRAGGQDDDERGNALGVDNDCNVYVTGYYAQTTTFGSTPITSVGGKDIFITKIQDACFDYVVDTIIDTVIVVDPPDDPPIPDTIPFIELKMYVPTAFTPNGDELNNTFTPSISTSLAPTNYRLAVYDRWGNLIFESYDYRFGWDGTLGTKMCQQGIYTWTIDFEYMKNKISKRGHVLLIN